jgi:conjugative transfer pilus assembly protein TraH
MKKSRLFSIRKLVAVVALCGFTTAQAGWLQDFYNEVGAYNNTTAPGAYNGQTQNLYTGGSAFIRVPQKNYQLYSVAPPSLSAGCGGIDLFAGSFSFINKDQFVAMLRNIGQAAIGQAFMLALKSMAPEVAEVMQYMQTTAQRMNAGTLNACAEGKKLVDGPVSEWMSANSRQAADWALALNREPDALAAYQKTRGDNTEMQLAMNAAKAGLPGVTPPPGQSGSPLIAEGNIIWRALSQEVGGLTIEEKRILMSLIGTAILSQNPDGTNQQIQFKLGFIKLSDLMGKKGVSTTLLLYDCIDGTGDNECRVVEPIAPFNTVGFSKIVYDRLQLMKSSMLDRTAQPLDSIDFAELTSFPIQRMLSIGVVARSPNIAENMIDAYQDIIAAEYAAAFVRQGLDILDRAISQAKTNKTQVEGGQLKEFSERSRALRREVLQELGNAYANGTQIINVAQNLQHMERSLYSSMPASLTSSLSFQKGK